MPFRFMVVLAILLVWGVFGSQFFITESAPKDLKDAERVEGVIGTITCKKSKRRYQSTFEVETTSSKIINFIVRNTDCEFFDVDSLAGESFTAYLQKDEVIQFSTSKLSLVDFSEYRITANLYTFVFFILPLFVFLIPFIAYINSQLKTAKKKEGKNGDAY